MEKGIFVNEKEFKTLDALEMERQLASRSNASGEFFSWFNQLPDPDPILQKLGESVKVYKDLMSDDQVSSTTQRLNDEVRKIEWKIKAADGMDENSKEMQLCRDTIKLLEDNGTAVKDIISQSLSAHQWGLAAFEANYNIEKKPWLPNKLQLKPPEWFAFDGDNNLLFKSLYEPVGIPLTGPEAKKEFKYTFFLLRNQPTYENPYGDKVLSRCFWPVTFKRGIIKFGMLFIEKYGMPNLEIKHPPKDDPETVTKLVESAALMIQDSVIAIPDGNQMTIHRAGEKQSGELYKLYIDMFDAMIDKAILNNTFATSQQTKGGYSTAKEGSDIVYEKGRQLRDYPEELFNKLFRAVIDLNIGSGQYPTFSFYDEDEPKKDFAERDKSLSEAAQNSGQKIRWKKSYYINNYGYKDDEFEIEEAATDNSNTQPITDPQFSEADPKKKISEQIADSIPEKLMQFQMEEVLKPVLQLAEDSIGAEDFKNKLLKLYPKLNAEEIQKLAAKAMFIAEIEGRIAADSERK